METTNQTATAPAKPKRTRKAPATKAPAIGGQKQSAGKEKPLSAAAALKKVRQQNGMQQSGESQGSAGATGSGKSPEAQEIRGGTKQVLIQNTKVPGRGGRPQGAEDYPFSQLTPAKKVAGDIEGPSFFIPNEDNPDSHLATARKRYKPTKFWSRATIEKVNPGDTEVTGGLRIWKAPA